MHISGLLEVILQGSGSAAPVPPVLLLGCCPAAGLLPSYSPLHMVYWPVSWYLLHALDPVLRDTANLLATARIDVPA